MPINTSTGAPLVINIGAVGIAGTVAGMPLEAMILGAIAGAVAHGLNRAGMDINKRYVAFQYNSWLNKEAEKKGIHIIDYNTFADENFGVHYRMIRYKNSTRGAGLTASGAKLLAERILSGRIKMPMIKKFKLKSELGFSANNASSWVNKVNLKLKNGSKVVDAVYEKAKGNEVVILNEFDFLTSPNIEITMFDAEVRSDIGYGEYGLNRIEIIEA